MSRRCYANNELLVNSLLTSDHVKSVMKQVDRKHFCKDELNCYCDKPSPILLNQTISAPHMHAKAIEYLLPNLHEGSSVLDVGSGSGYLTACFAHSVNVVSPNKDKRGKVIGLEIYKPLVTYSLKRIFKNKPELFTYKSRFKLQHGSGWEGYPAKSTKEIYDAIHVGASTDSIPYYLVMQLKVGGRMVLPLQLGKDKGHTFCILTKDKHKNIYIETKEAVRYVPLLK